MIEIHITGNQGEGKTAILELIHATLWHHGFRKQTSFDEGDLCIGTAPVNHKQLAIIKHKDPTIVLMAGKRPSRREINKLV
jgi:recombinational DNA repair ATPase RecF